MMFRRREDKVKRNWEGARVYAETDFFEVNQRFVRRLFELVGERHTTPWVLDLGAGPGAITQHMASARPHWRVVGLDFAHAMLAFAQGLPQERVSAHWLLGDAKACPFPSQHFDVVCSNSILHQIPEPRLLWDEVKRVAKPGAVIFFRDLFRPDSAEEAGRLVQHYAGDASALLQQQFFRSFLSAFTPEEIAEQLMQAGLHSLHVDAVTDRHVDVWGQLAE